MSMIQNFYVLVEQYPGVGWCWLDWSDLHSCIKGKKAVYSAIHCMRKHRTAGAVMCIYNERLAIITFMDKTYFELLEL